MADGRLTSVDIVCMVSAVMRLTARCLLLTFLPVLAGVDPSAFAADVPSDRPPVPFRLSRPAYPESLVLYRIRGEVRLAFDVDADGYVENFEVVYASHPDFIPPALKVAQGWRYRAARKDGKPVATRWQETVYSDVISRGAEAFAIPEKGPREVPEDFRYDFPPSIQKVVQVVYPYQTLLDGKTGSADVAFVVDSDGRVRDLTVRKASSTEFGLALVAAMAMWEFEPAKKDGQPAPAVLVRGQHFGVGEDDVLLSETARRLRQVLLKSKEDIVEYNRLDAPPRPLERPAPVFPQKFMGKAGRAEIEFIIDRDGQAQLPRVVSATAPEYGWAAATAVALWRFEPPLRDGQPVDARARIPMEFTPAATKEPAAAEPDDDAVEAPKEQDEQSVDP